MTGTFMNMLWSVEFRFGIGLDLESCDSRPIWAIRNNEMTAMAFDGLVLLIPFFVITAGRVWEEDEDAV